MAAKTPLARVNEQFGDKAKLVAAVEKLSKDDLWVSRTNENKGLAHVSNAKLLRLLATFTEVKAKFGTRDKLVSAVLDLEERGKDAGLRAKLSTWPVPRLWDAHRSAAKRKAAAASADKPARSARAEQAPSKAAKPAKASKSTKAAAPKATK